MLKKFTIILVFFFTSVRPERVEGYEQKNLDKIELSVKPEHFQKMKLMLGLVNPAFDLEQISNYLKKDLEFGKQFEVDIKKINKLHSKSELMQLSKSGYGLAIFLNVVDSGLFGQKGIEWRLYDLSSAAMLKGKKVFQTKPHLNTFAHKIADQVWPELTGQVGIFSTVLAACKKNNITKKKYHTYVYVLHPIEYLHKLSEPKLVIKDPTICLLPEWNLHKPLLYYSKHTDCNVRLNSIDTNLKRSIVSNFDGLNINPAFSKSGKILVCLAKDGKGRICQYKYDEVSKKGTFVSLTDRKIHAISPSFIDEDNFVFCAVDSYNRPKLAIFNIPKSEISYIKNGESCEGPTYCSENNKIAYCKKVDGYLQIFTRQYLKENEKQLTFDNSDKDSLSWSVCGNFIAFSCESGSTSQIAILNLLNNQITYLTPKNEHWSCPAWSPVYEDIPFLN